MRTPGVDRSGDRQALMRAYLARRNDPNALLDLAKGLKGAKDTPATTVRSGRAKTGKSSASIIEIGKLAQRMGLHVGENPKFGGVHPVHTQTSWHYKGKAVDVSGDPAKMRRFARVVSNRYGRNLEELFWNGSGARNIKSGKRVGKGFVSGHTDHVHVAAKR
jgi:hypothetical protein